MHFDLRLNGSVSFTIRVGFFLLVVAAPGLLHSQITKYGFDANGSLVIRALENPVPPEIAHQPQTQIVAPGELASFSVVLADTRAVTYQWRFNGTNMPGRTNDALLLLDASTNNQGPYDVVVTNLSGSVTSMVAQLYFDSDGDGLPDSWELTYFGDLISQRSGGDADGDGSSNLREFFDGTNPTNSASHNLQLTIRSDGGSVAAAPTTLNYTNGESVTLTATPFPPNSFYSWTGDLMSRSNPAALTMNSNKTVLAHFISALPPSGMVGWWRAENNALDALGANPGLLSNGVAFAAGQVGQAFQFNATNQEVKVPASASLNVGPGAGLTIEMWIKPDDLLAQRPLAEWNDGANIGVHFWLNVGFSGQGGPGAIFVNVRDPNLGDHYFVSPAGLVGTNVWQHVAVTYDRPSGNARLYFNGLTVASVNLGSFVPRTSANLHLGYRPASVSYSGLMDEPTLYNRALTPSEVLRLYLADAAGKSPIIPYFTSPAQFLDATAGINYTQQVTTVLGTLPVGFSLSAGSLPSGLTLSSSGLVSGVPTTAGSNVFAVLATDAAGLSRELVCGLRVLAAGTPVMAPGLVAWWRAENDALDSVGTNHGILTNGPGFATGKVGQAFSFDGTTNYVQVGNNPGLNFSNSLSIEAWIFPTGAGSDPTFGGTIINKEYQYEVARFSDGTISWAFANSSPGWNWVSTGFVAPLNQWTHVVVVYDNGVVSTYGNGVLVQSYGGAGPIGFAQIGQNDFRIGGRPSTTQFFQGRIDEISLYRSVLMSNEVASLFNAGAGGKIVVGPYINTGSLLPDAVSGQGYTQAIAAIRGTAPVNFTLTSGALPGGLTLSPGGLLSGILTALGGFNFTITATDASALSNRQTFTLQVYGKIPPPAGLVGWWRAETNALDSAGLNNGTLVNGTAFAPGKVGQAFSLDGVNDSVDIADAPALRPASVTLETWAFFTATGTRILLGKPVGSGFSDSYQIYISNGNLGAFVGDDAGIGTQLNFPFSPVFGRWYHMAYTFDDGTKQQALYLDSVQVASGVANKTIGYDSQPLLLGRDIENGSPNYFFSGRLDEAAIYNRALGSNEIASVFNSGPGGKTASGPYFSTPPLLPDAVARLGYTQTIPTVRGTLPVSVAVVAGALPAGLTLSSVGVLSGTPANAGSFSFTVRATDAAALTADQTFTLQVLPKLSPPAGLVGWWRAEDNALDAAGTSDGNLINGATFAPGKVGQGFSLDGVDDAIEIADAPALRPASITLEAWVMFFSAGGIQEIITKTVGSGGADSYALWYDSGNLRGMISDIAGANSFISAPFTAVLGRWYHVAFTFDDSTKQQWLYLDGVAIATGASNRAIGYDAHSVLLGADIESGFQGFVLQGRIDEAAIYNRALGAAEIASLYSAGSGGKTIAGPYINTPPQLPSGAVGQGYTQTLASSRGTPAITYALAGGVLPGGLALSTAGTLSGTPTNTGGFNFVIRATDSTGLSGDQAFTLEVFPQVPPPAGLISWWRAENNGLDSAGANHGLVTNGAAYAAGEVGQAFSLDGVNDYIQIADAPSLRPASVTLETWVLFTATGTRILLGKPVGGGTSDSYQIYLSAGTLGAFVGDAGGAGTVLSIPFIPVLGRWYHVAYTFDDASLQQVLYLDGITVASGSGSKRIGYDAQPVLLGCDTENGSRTFFLSGRIDEAAIYNRALRADEIAALHDSGAAGKTTAGPYFSTAPPLPDGVVGRAYSQAMTALRGAPPIVHALVQGALPDGLTLSPGGLLSGTPTSASDNTFVIRATDFAGLIAEQFYTLEVFAPVAPPSGLLAWWKADDNALDSVGTNRGTLLGGVTFAAGKVNSAFDLNGTNAYVAISNSAWLNPTAAFSVEAWIKASLQQFSPDGYSLIVDKSHGFTDSTGWALQGNPNGTVSFFFGLGGGGPFNFIGPSTPGSLRDDRWHHLAGVFTGAQITLYQDGTLISGTSNTNLPVGNGRNVEIGRSWGGGSPARYFHGLIDEVSFYGHALSEDEIIAIYNAGPAGKGLVSFTPPLVLRPSRQGEMFVLSFDSVIGQSYTVQSALSIPGGWTTFSNITATQTNVVFSESITNAQQRYFRVVTPGN